MYFGDARPRRFCLRRSRLTAAKAWLSPQTTATVLCVTLAAGFLRSASFSAKDRCFADTSFKRCSPHRMLLGTGRYQVGSGECLPHRMLLEAVRYQVGSGGCSPHRTLVGMNMTDLRRWMLFALAASRKRSLPRNA